MTTAQKNNQKKKTPENNNDLQQLQNYTNTLGTSGEGNKNREEDICFVPVPPCIPGLDERQ